MQIFRFARSGADAHAILLRHFYQAGFRMSQGKYRQPGGQAAGKFCRQTEEVAAVIPVQLHHHKSPGAFSQFGRKLRLRQIATFVNPRRVKPEAIAIGMGTENFERNFLGELVTDGSKCLDKFGEIFFATDGSGVSDPDLDRPGRRSWFADIRNLPSSKGQREQPRSRYVRCSRSQILQSSD